MDNGYRDYDILLVTRQLEGEREIPRILPKASAGRRAAKAIRSLMVTVALKVGQGLTSG